MTPAPAHSDIGFEPDNLHSDLGFTADQPESKSSRARQLFQGMKDVGSGLARTITRSDETNAAQDHLAKGEYGHAALKILEASMPGYSLFVKPAIEQATMAYHMATHGRYSEAAGHFGAALLPGVGPAAAGMMDLALGESVMPLGQQMEVPHSGEPYRAAGQFAASAALAAGPKLVTAIPRMVDATGAAETLRASAEKGYAQALNPTTKANKAITARIVPGLIERGETPLTLKGLQARAQAHIESIGSAIGDAWDNLPQGTKTDFEPVYNKLQEAIDKTHSVPNAGGTMIPKGPEAVRAIGNIESLQQTLLDVSETDPATGKVQIPVDKIHSLKQYFDDIAARAGRYSGKDLADQSAAEAHGLAADAIREELANDHPNIAAMNKEYSFWKNVNRVTSETIERRQGQAKPLGRKLANVAGKVGGFFGGGVHGAILGGAAMDSLEAATTSTGWRTVSASLKAKLADAIASGNQSAISFYSQQALRSGAALSLSSEAESNSRPVSIEAGAGR